jgi:phage-related protein
LLDSLEGVREFQWSPNGLNRQNYICENWQVTPTTIGYGRFAGTFERWNGAARLVPKPTTPPEIDLVFSWDTMHDNTAIVNERRVGEGVDRRASLFKNSIQRSFPVRVITLDEPGLDLFLSDLYGSPFRLKPINRRLNEPADMLFNCVRWSFERTGVGVSLFSTDFNQVHRP